VYGGGSVLIALLAIIEWLSHWSLLTMLGLGLIFAFVLAFVCGFACVEDKTVLKGLFLLLLPVPFFAVAMFLGANGMWTYGLLLTFAVILVRFAVLNPSLKRWARNRSVDTN
jgi:hypothetical protein